MDRLKGKRKFFILLIGSFLYILILTFLFERRGLIDVLNSRKELSKIQKEVEVLREKKVRLEWEIKVLRENIISVEEMARKDLGLVYPDEIIVIIDEEYLRLQK
jgi:cell division protein FtsB